MKNKLEYLVNNLVHEFRNSVELEDGVLRLYNCELIFNDCNETVIWIENMDTYNNKFTVCICRKSNREYPNIESYIENRLSERIKLCDIWNELEEEERENDMSDTYRCICESYGWSY